MINMIFLVRLGFINVNIILLGFMLEQESHNKKYETHNRTKSKFHISKVLKSKNNQVNQAPPPFNDPLYEHLDNQVLNKQQPNFGPWVQNEKLKSRQRNRISQGQLPIIYRPQDTTARYYQQQETTMQNYNLNHALPTIQQRNNRAFSLQNLRAASLQFNPDVQRRQGNSTFRTPFHLKMHGLAYPSPVDQLEGHRKSTFLYNCCFYEGESSKLLNLKMKGKLSKNQNYLKIRSQNQNPSPEKQISANQQLFKQLKQHRLNKLK